MQQYFVKGELALGESVILDAMQLHHIQHVLRMHEGDQICLADAASQLFVAELKQHKDTFCAVVKEQLPSCTPAVEIILAAALIKGERWDFLCQKCTELGVSIIQPLMTRRCVVKLKDSDIAKKTIRWNRIAQEACEQCRRSDLVQIMAPCTLKDLVQQEAELKLLAYEHADQVSERMFDIIKAYPNVKKIICVIGPEGGFCEEEAVYLQAHGFLSVSLGARILRAETAAISIVNLLSSLYNS